MPDNSMPKEAAFQIINDELMLDGNPRLNLASFVTTWMEPECDKLIMDSINKNYVDMDEYPVTTELQNRCVNMIAHLFNAPVGDDETAIGVGTVGSSEAIMLAGLAFKRKWQKKRKEQGKPYDKPNIVTGANVQVCWEKFARYFEVELKEVKLEEGYYVMDPLKAVGLVDENTICVAAILGSTLTGEFEDVKLLNELLSKKNQETGWDTPIHVDAASGGFIAPFLYPDLEWDFRLPLVKSINVSGHKYGLVYAGVGWVVWRTKDDLPDELVFHINYLGSDQPTFTLNFSKGSSQIIAQYYQFLRLGFEGYNNIIENCMENARVLREGLEKTGRFQILSKDVGVPLVAFALKDSSKHTVFEISEGLRKFGWIVPAYTMPANAEHVAVLRVVIREDFSRRFQENYKFRDYVSPKLGGANNKGMGAFVRDLKGEFKTVDQVYVWHALCGYWGGLRPNVPWLPETTVVKPKLSPGLELTMEDLAVDKIVNTGIGLVPPELVDQMYEGLHSHLEKIGIDGVKVDVIHLLEMVCENYGGRVDLAKAYYKALTESVKKHFNGNGVIASMEHCNDFMFLGTEAIALGRVGDDFWCTDPSGDPNGTFWLQGCHMVHCAYNSLWMGNFIHPDWDMFQSTHPCAEFHAASRAISGGPIYVSDTVGKHNFPLLKRLAMPDGTILRCQYYALPTRDCLFDDPLHDGKTMLKIWNLNKFTGVIGAFNCQGGGWCPENRRNKCASQFSHKVTAKTDPKDIEWNSGKNPISIEGVQVFAMYLQEAKKLVLSKPSENIEISLEPFKFELITVAPVTVLARTSSVQFAPIGLVNMLNTGGAIQSLYYNDGEDSVEIEVKGSGEIRVFASEKPRACKIDGNEVAFDYEGQMVAIQVPWSSPSGLSVIDYLF